MNFSTEKDVISEYKKLMQLKFRPANACIHEKNTANTGTNDQKRRSVSLGSGLANKHCLPGAMAARVERNRAKAESAPAKALGTTAKIIIDMQLLRNELHTSKSQVKQLQEAATRTHVTMETIRTAKGKAEGDVIQLRIQNDVDVKTIAGLRLQVEEAEAKLRASEIEVSNLKSEILKLRQFNDDLQTKCFSAETRISNWTCIAQTLECDNSQLRATMQTVSSRCLPNRHVKEYVDCCHNERFLGRKKPFKKKYPRGPTTDPEPEGYSPKLGEFYVEFFDKDNANFKRSKLVVQELQKVFGEDAKASSSRGKGRVYFPCLMSAQTAYDSLNHFKPIQISELKLNLIARKPKQML